MSASGGPARVSRDELVAYLDDYLQASQGEDFCPNGLQVEGRSTISRLVTGVSACQELFDAAGERDADAVLVHHGIFWGSQPRVLTGLHGRRVRSLMVHDLNLIAYHLPLDRHPEVGNNAVAAARLGLERTAPFGDYAGASLGFQGAFPQPVALPELAERCQGVFGREPLVFEGDGRISTVGVISGAAQKEFYTAIYAGLDAYVTGEASEWVMNLARESGTHYLSVGHYAGERLGVEALGEHLRERFGLEVAFVDVPNPV